MTTKDDHTKNFAFIYRNGEWHFGPAFDLLPSNGINGLRTTSINDNIESTKQDILTLATKVGLNAKEAAAEFEKIKEIICNKLH